MNEGPKHKRKDKIRDFATGAVLIRVGNNDYTAKVIVGTEASGKMKLYDIIDLTPTTIIEKETATATGANPSPGAARNTVAISYTRISQKSGSVKERFSVEDSVAEDGTKDSYSTLPAKARDFVKRAERTLLEKIGQVLSVPRTARRDFLAQVVRAITNEYLQNGTVSQQTIDGLFQQAYAQGVVADEEYYNQYKHIKDHIRTTAVNMDKYLEYVDSGLSAYEASNMVRSVTALEPAEGKKSVSNIQKWRAVIDTQDSVEDQLAALSAEMTPSQYNKVSVGNDYGVEPEIYVQLKELLPEYNTDGNNNSSNKEITAAIDALAMKLNLTTQQKSVLWQITANTASAKNNPYSTEIGWKVIDALDKLEEGEADKSLSFGELFTKQLLENW